MAQGLNLKKNGQIVNKRIFVEHCFTHDTTLDGLKHGVHVSHYPFRG